MGLKDELDGEQIERERGDWVSCTRRPSKPRPPSLLFSSSSASTKGDFHRSRQNAHPFRDGRRHLLPFPGSFFTGIEANRSGPSRGFSRRCPVPIKPLRMKMI
ncbi:hypothetical protein YC2023_099285 [Brassica napus]